MDGLEAMRRIRQDPRLQKLPIIVVTAKCHEGRPGTVPAAGANDYHKPRPDRLFSPSGVDARGWADLSMSKIVCSTTAAIAEAAEAGNALQVTTTTRAQTPDGGDLFEALRYDFRDHSAVFAKRRVLYALTQLVRPSIPELQSRGA
jgi:CheY-like chemotaxis protein